MRILESQVSLTGRSARSTSAYVRESLAAWAGSARIDYNREEKFSSAAAMASGDQVDLSATAKDLAKKLETEQPLTDTEKALADAVEQIKAAQKKKETDEFEGLSLDAKFSLKILLIEALTGHKVLLFSSRRSADDAPAEAPAKDADQNRNAANGEPARLGWGISYQRHEETKQSESTRFTTDGVVKTADGKEIAFRAELEMNHERITVNDIFLRAGDALTDPLVINYGGTAAELTDQKYDFDLDADGTSEKVSFVKSGSGFLVLDRNGDGQATDGTELFGPTTGDGFKELATFDEDANGWIDEGDSVFGDLRVWSKNAAGQDQYDTLAGKNVGAIYLQKAGTQIGLYDSQNDKEGQVRSTGVYLTEDGQAQTIQQVDLKT
ncbi:MAG: hypothetical protein GX444_01225 [Myxococcales bacterium]|nr:hypothetical protein [Myxococcales bacterium]